MYRTGALTIHWERLIAGADVIGGTGSESSQLPVVDSVEFAMCVSSSRKSSTFVPMLVPPGTFLRSFLFLQYCCPCVVTILYERGVVWSILITLAGFHLPSYVVIITEFPLARPFNSLALRS